MGDLSVYEMRDTLCFAYVLYRWDFWRIWYVELVKILLNIDNNMWREYTGN